MLGVTKGGPFLSPWRCSCSDATRGATQGYPERGEEPGKSEEMALLIPLTPEFAFTLDPATYAGGVKEVPILEERTRGEDRTPPPRGGKRVRWVGG